MEEESILFNKRREKMNEMPQECYVTSWVIINLRLNPASSVTFKEVYRIYSEQAIGLQVIPLSKKVFSNRLRNIFKQHIQDNKVQIVNRGGVLIKGVEIYGNNNSKQKPGIEITYSK